MSNPQKFVCGLPQQAHGIGTTVCPVCMAQTNREANRFCGVRHLGRDDIRVFRHALYPTNPEGPPLTETRLLLRSVQNTHPIRA